VALLNVKVLCKWLPPEEIHKLAEIFREHNIGNPEMSAKWDALRAWHNAFPRATEAEYEAFARTLWPDEDEGADR
jgi:hypothetical protein